MIVPIHSFTLLANNLQSFTGLPNLPTCLILRGCLPPERKESGNSTINFSFNDTIDFGSTIDSLSFTGQARSLVFFLSFLCLMVWYRLTFFSAVKKGVQGAVSRVQGTIGRCGIPIRCIFPMSIGAKTDSLRVWFQNKGI